jgi:hypothetical protein
MKSEEATAGGKAEEGQGPTYGCWANNDDDDEKVQHY